MRTRILVRLFHHKKLDFDMKNVLSVPVPRYIICYKTHLRTVGQKPFWERLEVIYLLILVNFRSTVSSVCYCSLLGKDKGGDSLVFSLLSFFELTENVADPGVYPDFFHPGSLIPYCGSNNTNMRTEKINWLSYFF
jgi:hypothetical protein